MDRGQNADQLGDRQGRVSVVNLNAHFVGKGSEVVMHAEVVADDILQRG